MKHARIERSRAVPRHKGRRRINTARLVGPMKWAGALVLVFLLGIGLGVSGALWLGSEPPVRSAAVGSLPDQVEDDGGYELPVSVAASDSARARYEELLSDQPDAVRPNPDAAPAAARRIIASRVEPGPREAVEAAISPNVTTAPSAPPPSTETSKPLLTPGAPARRTQDAELPWIANAAPVSLEPGRPMIAVVIDDVGLDQPRSRAAIALPGPLTIAMLPYGYNLPDLAMETRRQGHELLVHMPMEPLDPGANPGPRALLTGLGPKELRQRVAWDLEQFSGYVGINNHMGSRFTANEAGMRIVMDEVRARGLLFLDSVTSRNTTGFRLAAKAGVPHAVRDIFLDHDIALPAIRKQLGKVEATARRQGHAIAIGHPHDETLEALRAWLPTLRGKGFQIVPISAIVRARYPAG